MAATALYLLKAKMPSVMKCRPEEKLNKHNENALAEITQRKPSEIMTPLAALDYRTLEGRHMPRKRKQKYVTMETPTEIQKMKTYVKSLSIARLNTGEKRYRLCFTWNVMWWCKC